MSGNHIIIMIAKISHNEIVLAQDLNPQLQRRRRNWYMQDVTGILMHKPGGYLHERILF